MIARLSQSERFVGLRDATGDISRPQRLRALVRPGFRLLSGDDATAPAFLAHGGDGCISVTSNLIPQLCQDLYRCCAEGDLKAARALAVQISHLTAALLREPPSVSIKYALSLLELMTPHVRLPLIELSDTGKAAIAKTIRAADGLGPHPLKQLETPYAQPADAIR